MEIEKIRNLSDEELKVEEGKAREQIFRLRFQMKLGQTEGVKKLRELKKDVAKMQTITRERAIGIRGAASLEKAAVEAKSGAKTGRTRKSKKEAL
jgi:large subunit ribosomal protein L29